MHYIKTFSTFKKMMANMIDWVFLVLNLLFFRSVLAPIINVCFLEKVLFLSKEKEKKERANARESWIAGWVSASLRLLHHFPLCSWSQQLLSRIEFKLGRCLWLTLKGIFLASEELGRGHTSLQKMPPSFSFCSSPFSPSPQSHAVSMQVCLCESSTTCYQTHTSLY